MFRAVVMYKCAAGAGIVLCSLRDAVEAVKKAKRRVVEEAQTTKLESNVCFVLFVTDVSSLQ